MAGVAWGPADHEVWSIVLAFTLTWATFVDIDRLILPDAITLGLVATGLLLHAQCGIENLLPFLVGAILGYALLVLAALSYRRVKGRDGLGKGDAKFLAAAGAWLGWVAIPGALLIAAGAALAFVLAAGLARRSFEPSQRIPFGPFLAAGFWLQWMLGAAFASENFFGLQAG